MKRNNKINLKTKKNELEFVIGEIYSLIRNMKKEKYNIEEAVYEIDENFSNFLKTRMVEGLKRID
jgi:hypothetical protein